MENPVEKGGAWRGERLDKEAGFSATSRLARGERPLNELVAFLHELVQLRLYCSWVILKHQGARDVGAILWRCVPKERDFNPVGLFWYIWSALRRFGSTFGFIAGKNMAALEEEPAGLAQVEQEAHQHEQQLEQHHGMHEGGMHEGEMHEGGMHEGEMHEGVMHDGAPVHPGHPGHEEVEIEGEEYDDDPMSVRDPSNTKQLTLSYQGEVYVFDTVPPEKVRGQLSSHMGISQFRDLALTPSLTGILQCTALFVLPWWSRSCLSTWCKTDFGSY